MKARAFCEIFKEIDDGFFEDTVSQKFHEVVEAVESTKKKGEIVIKLTIKPKAGHDVMILTPDVKAKIPDSDKMDTLFFVTSDNNLVRKSPRQMELPMVGDGRVVDAQFEDQLQPQTAGA